MDKFFTEILVFTDKNCNFCRELTHKLNCEDINYYEFDVNENSEEFDIFEELTNNDIVPAIIIYNRLNNFTNTLLPNKDFNSIDELILRLTNKQLT